MDDKDKTDDGMIAPSMTVSAAMAPRANRSSLEVAMTTPVNIGGGDDSGSRRLTRLAAPAAQAQSKSSQRAVAR
jgi:hypothetical protein